jgi:sterol desaturase/sphingolipid hydroxylase (fatty acid hydroxylase superfamily)
MVNFGFSASYVYKGTIRLVSEAFYSSLNEIKKNAPTREIIILGLILTILQISDGLLTGVGVGLFGTAAEGNPLLRCLMEHCGIMPTLFTAKTLAILSIYVVCRLSIKVRWANNAIRSLIAVYLLLAIAPWMSILLDHATRG